MAERLDSHDVKPFVAVLTAVRDAGRAARDRGEISELVDLGYRSHAVLKWMEADEAQDFVAAERWLAVAYGRTSSATNR